MIKQVFFACLLMCNIAHAEPYGNADAAAGKTLVVKNCISCHAHSFGGDGSGIYVRNDRKVKTSKGLVAQVRTCNTMLGLKWFEEEELNVAKYLNQSYYKFTE
ncbi:MAG: cytochrome c [Methylotenera sp.]|uniref:c-type cytochrome n=1 Tax=Methylotenera sp. TaxID=2051956 RepID=UPI00182FBD62|nr:cytochrome c [Methylotenera sp.]NOU25751.1 cytochrome c [Methylotenera sp.]